MAPTRIRKPKHSALPERLRPRKSPSPGRAKVLVSAVLEAHRSEIAVEDLELATHVLANAIHSLTHDGVLSRPASLDDETLVREVMRLVMGYLSA